MKDLDLNGQLEQRGELSPWSHLRNLPHIEVDMPQVLLLIGENVPLAHKIIEQRFGIDPANQPYAVRTMLGWYVAGPISNDRDRCSQLAYSVVNPMELMSSSISCCDPETEQQNLERAIHKLWNYDQHGFGNTAAKTMSIEDKEALRSMNSSTKLVNGHYSIDMLWKDQYVMMPCNLIVAKRCLEHVKKRILEHPSFGAKYRAMMSHYISNGYAVPLSSDEVAMKTNKTWYLPHHGVENVHKPDKVRIVFNAAATYRGMSLNSNLIHGPDLNNNLVGCILRFRQGPVALSADIEDMFHQVLVPPNNSDSLRFLWFTDETCDHITTYKMTRHIFGATDSPTTCTFALKRCATDNANDFSKLTVDTVLNHFYVDDLLKALSSVPEAVSLAKELILMLARGGFKLGKFVSNKQKVLDELPKDRIAKSCQEINFDVEPSSAPTERALGLSWKVRDDTLSVKLNSDVVKPATRRGCLSFLAAIIDPLGFISPVVLMGKLVLQEACRQELNWDTDLPEDLAKRWVRWRKDLPILDTFCMPRCYEGFENFSKAKHLEIHHFSDASKVGFGVVSYLRVETNDGKVHISLIQAKSRCHPLRYLSVPRSEIQAAVLAVRMDRFLQYELKLKVDKVVFWTDSTTVIQYVRNRSKRFKSYIAVRLEEIRDTTEPEMWRYCNTKENPADIASRGETASRLLKCAKWFEGPTFLKKPMSDWPRDPTVPAIERDDPEVEQTNALETKPVWQINEMLNNTSTWETLVNRMSIIVKFARHFMARCGRSVFDVDSVTITVEDRRIAVTTILRLVQLEEYPEELKALRAEKPIPTSSRVVKLLPVLLDNVMRVGGRIRQAQLPLDTRHPYILPKDHNVTRAIVRWAHAVVYHAGPDLTLAKVRETFWIPDGRAVVKSVINKCVLCKRIEGRTLEQKMSELPEARVTAHKPPFTVTGTDCFGPIYVKRGPSNVKRYGVIFCCFATRAVHLEILPDMTTDSMINALRRFSGRRVNVEEIWSDNGSNLVGADREMRRAMKEWNSLNITRTLLQKGIKWKFQSPYSPHKSGVWERLIRSTKRCLVAALGNKNVSEDVLHTALVEVEYCLNSFPITPLSDDPNDLRCLTPSQIIAPTKVDSLPPGVFDSDDLYRRKWRQSQYLANLWWTRWISEYLPMLQTTQKWTRERRNVAVGDIVLLIDNTTERGNWPLGRIVKVYPGTDNHVRTADVKTVDGVFKRPIVKLCLLEKSAADC